VLVARHLHAALDRRGRPQVGTDYPQKLPGTRRAGLREFRLRPLGLGNCVVGIRSFFLFMLLI
jgi:hypothetical protein